MAIEFWIQLDWPSETDTQKINLLRDRDGYDKSGTTSEKLLLRRIVWCEYPSSVFVFWRVNFGKKDEKNPNKLGSTHSWMRLTRQKLVLHT